METQIKLTNNEVKGIKTCLNYKTRQQNLDDNASAICESQICRELNWKKRQVSGLISSLQKKGLLQIQEYDNVFYINEDGINAYFDAIGE